MSKDSLDMSLLLGALLLAQVPLPGHNEKVVVVKLIVQLCTEAGADYPPGGEDGPSTVVAAKT